jgi:heme exporter protein B
MSFGIAAPGLFLAILALGAIGLAAASTFIAAIVSKTAAKGALFAVLATPLLLPPLVAAVTGTRIAATEPELAAGLDVLRLLFAFDGLMVTASFLLFDAVWRE